MAVVAKHELRFGVRGFRVIALNIVEHVTVRHNQIARAVIVIVEKPRAEAAHVKCRIRKFGAKSCIVK